MKKILIVGAGGFGRELLQWIKDINVKQETWRIAGFLDDDAGALDGFQCDYPIVGKISDWQPREDEVFALALGAPSVKARLAGLLKARGAVFPPIVHPSSILTPFAAYGEGLVMFPYAKLSVNAAVGDFVTILSSGIGHDVTIGDYTTVSGMCSILRNVTIGKRVFIAAGVSVANDVHVGDDAYIGLGSVVLKDVPGGMKTYGNPARCVPCQLHSASDGGNET